MPVTTWVPVFLFVILFGLSMDYEVFLLSRIREEYDRLGDNSAAVGRGLAATARVISAAAAIMVVVFLSFDLTPDVSVKQIGLGLAAAVLVDATVVRLVLVPAVMELLGRANWWLPGWLAGACPGAQPPRLEARRTGPRRSWLRSAEVPNGSGSRPCMVREPDQFRGRGGYAGSRWAHPARDVRARRHVPRGAPGGTRRARRVRRGVPRRAVRRRDLAPAGHQVRPAGHPDHRLPAARRVPAAPRAGRGPAGRPAHAATPAT